MLLEFALRVLDGFCDFFSARGKGFSFSNCGQSVSFFTSKDFIDNFFSQFVNWSLNKIDFDITSGLVDEQIIASSKELIVTVGGTDVVVMTVETLVVVEIVVPGADPSLLTSKLAVNVVLVD